MSGTVFDHQSREKENGTALKNESDTFKYVFVIKYYLSFKLMCLNGSIKNIISSSISALCEVILISALF